MILTVKKAGRNMREGSPHNMQEKISKLDFDTVALSEDGRSLVIIDQTLLPGEMKFISLSDQRDIREAIYRLKVRGAPAIGVTAIGLDRGTGDFGDSREGRRIFHQTVSCKTVSRSIASYSGKPEMGS